MNKYFMKKEIKFSYVCWIFLDNNPTKCCNCAGNVIQIVVVLALTLTIIDFIFRAIVIRFQLTFSIANFCILVMHSAWLGPVPLLGILPLQLETRNCLWSMNNVSTMAACVFTNDPMAAEFLKYKARLVLMIWL